MSKFLNLINEWKVDAWYLPFSCSTVNASLCRVNVFTTEKDHYSLRLNATSHIVAGGGGSDLSTLSSYSPF